MLISYLEKGTVGLHSDSLNKGAHKSSFKEFIKTKGTILGVLLTEP